MRSTPKVASGTPGTSIGVGERLVGEHVGAGEPVRGDLVDGVEHERAEDRHARTDRTEVGAHIGQQIDVEAGDGAVAAGGDLQPLDLVPPVVGGHQRFGAGLGVLDRLVQLAGDHQRDDLLRGGLQFAAEPAADVRGDDAEFVLRNALGQRNQHPQHVWDLSGRPHRDLLGRRIHDGRSRLHERRDQSLLAEDPLDHHLIRIVLRGGERGDHITAGAGRAGIEDPDRVLVGAEFGVDQRRSVRQRGFHVEHHVEWLVVDFDRFESVDGFGLAPRRDHGDHLAGAVDRAPPRPAVAPATSCRR